jgi:hypothetical protein
MGATARLIKMVEDEARVQTSINPDCLEALVSKVAVNLTACFRLELKNEREHWYQYPSLQR